MKLLLSFDLMIRESRPVSRLPLSLCWICFWPAFARNPGFAAFVNFSTDVLLHLRSHRALYSRIAAHARVEGLSRAEVEPYLEHQLHQVGIERPYFEPVAVELLASASEGIPRIINLVAHAAWIQAAKDKSLQISASHLQSALDLVPGVMEIRQNSSHP
jgi:hypothetical protein